VIGVICDERERDVVREFFELFKTPWELYRPGRSYEVALVSGAQDTRGLDARVLLVFAAVATPDDARLGHETHVAPAGCTLEAEGLVLPLYGPVVTLGGAGSPRATVAGAPSPIVMRSSHAGQTILRCGYSLFHEVQALLTEGQPIEHAAVPTLDLHIALLRRWIVEAGVALVEIPPVPPACAFLACLTHDVDFLGIRRHRADATLLGFLLRATVGSALDVVRGRRTLRQLARNLAAVLKLPLVHLRLLPDPWLPFEKYAEVERDLRSTFFLVPFANRPGRGLAGPSHPRRAVKYGAQDARAWVEWLRARGAEVAVHGIDAWHDVKSAREERAAVAAVAGEHDLGVRMHWLFLAPDSLAKLDASGFAYDSTVGYNDAIGFRAGTAQVFRPLGSTRLLELPLHIQDTALLYPRRMHCRPGEATRIAHALLERVGQVGGVLTVSWHERSLVPERQWNDPYRALLEDLRAAGASIRPARDVVDWFRRRRAVDLEDREVVGMALAALAAPEPRRGSGADLVLRLHRRDGFTDVPARADDLIGLSSPAQAAVRSIGAAVPSSRHEKEVPTP
jgi:hypothetical protein